jgi:uncharacterized membrane protein YccC
MGKVIMAGILGIILGATGPYYLFMGSYSLVPWGLVGLALGFWCSMRQAFYAGAVYGFCLSFSFLIAGYNGTASIFSRFPFFALLALFGAVCGVALAATGYFLRLRFETPRRNGVRT